MKKKCVLIEKSTFEVLVYHLGSSPAIRTSGSLQQYIHLMCSSQIFICDIVIIILTITVTTAAIFSTIFVAGRFLKGCC